MRETLFDYCKRTGELELLRQWNSERNGALTPETVSYGSKKKNPYTCAYFYHRRYIFSVISEICPNPGICNQTENHHTTCADQSTYGSSM